MFADSSPTLTKSISMDNSTGQKNYSKEESHSFGDVELVDNIELGTRQHSDLDVSGKAIKAVIFQETDKKCNSNHDKHTSQIDELLNVPCADMITACSTGKVSFKFFLLSIIIIKYFWLVSRSVLSHYNYLVLNCRLIKAASYLKLS